ncbi:MAG: cytochrome b/b6 domain-containing protein [Hylemonella sp.]|nr:cytochrome b/b6 domain-containing protein [Hylemonella sp.]
MNTTASPHTPVASAAPRQAAATRRVIDAPTRMFHWLFALCFVGAYLTADGERLRLVHVVLGYSLAGLLVFRVLYGLFGPRQARLSLLWGKVANAPAWLRSVKAAWFGTGPNAAPVNWRQGQYLAMALTVIALLVVVLPLTLSGFAAFHEWGGEWLEEIHEAMGEFMLWLVLGHLAFLLVLSVLRRRNQATPMLTGRMEGTGPDLAKRNHAWLAALLLAGVLAYWAWEWQQAPPTAPTQVSCSRDRHTGDC